jgi:multiple sugar transport system substrate-binding protein
MKRIIALSVLSAALSVATAASAGTLQLNIAFKGAETRAVWENLIKQFQQANPA